MFYDAHTYEQEQGVSILYLAIGFLKWHEASGSDKPRMAPLLLIPVDLERKSAASRFQIRVRDEEVATNLSLQAKLQLEFGVEIPDVPEMEDLSPSDYFAKVRDAIASKKGWEVVHNDVVLWFFSFAKYLMYLDLDPTKWPEHARLEQSETLGTSLGLASSAGLASPLAQVPPLCGDDDPIDGLVAPEKVIHVADADSSQAVVIEEARRGRSLVVKGPPGTGKSQTIMNIIAAAVHDGKKVLFVAEKMAALEVVYSRLSAAGLGALCLQLHSNKANKKAVLKDLKDTLDMEPRKFSSRDDVAGELSEATARLNAHAEMMNTPLQPSGLSPFEIFGEIGRLHASGARPLENGLPQAETWSRERLAELKRLVRDFEAHLLGMGSLADHPWRGVRRTVPLSNAERGALLTLIDQCLPPLRTVLQTTTDLWAWMGSSPTEPACLQSARRCGKLAQTMLQAPRVDRARIANPVWTSHIAEIEKLVEHGRKLDVDRFGAQTKAIDEVAKSLPRIALSDRSAFSSIHRSQAMAKVEEDALIVGASACREAIGVIAHSDAEIRKAFGMPELADPCFQDVQDLYNFARNVLKAPGMDRHAAASEEWTIARTEVQRLVSLGKTTFEKAAALGQRVVDAAWKTDTAQIRKVMAGRGRSLFRFFHRDYRDAMFAFRSVLKGPAPKDLDGRLKMLDELQAVKTDEDELNRGEISTRVGKAAFGVDWKGSKSDWEKLRTIVVWDEKCLSYKSSKIKSHRKIISEFDNFSACEQAVKQLALKLKPAFEGASAVATTLSLSIQSASTSIPRPRPHSP